MTRVALSLMGYGISIWVSPLNNRIIQKILISNVSLTDFIITFFRILFIIVL